MHMLEENATSAWGQSREWVLHKHSCIQFIALVPSALVLWTVCTCACAKPIPEIVPMLKLDILYVGDETTQKLNFHFIFIEKILDGIMPKGTCNYGNRHQEELNQKKALFYVK